jgi:rubrerythrin
MRSLQFKPTATEGWVSKPQPQAPTVESIADVESAAVQSTAKTETKTRARRRLKPRWFLTGILAFFFVPWCPPLAPVALTSTPAGPSANALYEGLQVLTGNVRGHGTRPPTGIGKAAWAAWSKELAERPGEHAVPIGYQDPDGLRTIEQLQRQVQKNQAALEKLPEALRLPYYNGGVHDTRTYVGGTVRNLVVTLSHQGFLLEHVGKYPEAVETALRSVELGVQVGKGGNLQSWFLGESCHQIALQTLERTYAHLTPAQAQQTHQRLAALLTQHATLAQALAGERDQTARLLSFYRYPGTEGNILSRIPLVRLANQGVVNHYQAEVNHRIALVTHPDAHTVTELSKQTPAYDPASIALFPLHRVFENQQAQAARMARLLQHLKTQAGE